MDGILRSYLEQAPISLALERAIEARQIRSIDLVRPILDIGCGDGLFASIAMPDRPDIGLDLLPDELARSRRRGSYRQLVRGDAERLPFPDGAFATVLSNSALEHMRDIDAVLGEIARVVRIGGRVVITVPTPHYQEAFFWSRAFRAVRLGPLARAYERSVNAIFHHAHVYSAREWARRLAALGLAGEVVAPYLSDGVIALDDLLYPVGAPGKLLKTLTGSYVVPLFRPAIAGAIARALAGLYDARPRGDGGYVLLVCRRVGPAPLAASA